MPGKEFYYKVKNYDDERRIVSMHPRECADILKSDYEKRLLVDISLYPCQWYELAHTLGTTVREARLIGSSLF